MKYYYSNSDSEEYWTCDNLHDAVIDAIDHDQSINNGDTIEIYRGHVKKTVPSDMLPSYIFEQMKEVAFDNLHEDSAQRFSELLDNDQQSDLENALKAATDKFFRDVGVSIDFGEIVGVHPLTITVNDVLRYDWALDSSTKTS